MSDQILPILYRATDAAGNGLAGALAYFYLTGTTTPVTVYTDEGLTVPATNPVVANAAGVFAQVFYGGPDAVKVVITTAAGAAVSTVDPAPRFSSSTSAASGVSFVPNADVASTNVQDAITEIAQRAVEVPETTGKALHFMRANGAATDLELISRAATANALSIHSRMTYGGSANAITVATGLDLSAIPTGFQIRFRASAANTGAVTINVDGLGAATTVTVINAVLPADYIRTDADTVAVWTGSVWRVDREIQRIDNANGVSVRYANGVQRWRHRVAHAYTTTALGNIFAGTSPLITFTQPFISFPSIRASALSTAAWVSIADMSVFAVEVRLFSSVALTGAMVTVMLQADGVWY